MITEGHITFLCLLLHPLIMEGQVTVKPYCLYLGQIWAPTLVSRYSLNVEENIVQIQTLFRVLFMKCELIKSKLAWQVNLTNNEKFRTKSGKNWSSHNNHQPLNRNYHIKGENPWIGLLLLLYFQFESAWHLEVLKSILMLTLSQMVGGVGMFDCACCLEKLVEIQSWSIL